MKRSHRAALAALCVVALALGAATLENPVADEGGLGGDGSTGVGDEPDEGIGGSQDPNATRDLGDAIDFGGLCIPFFTSARFFLLLAAVALVVGAILYRKGGALLVLAVYGALFAPGLLLWMLVTTCGRPPPMERAGNFSLFPGTNGSVFQGSAGGGGPGTGAPSLATTVLLVLGLAVVLVALVMLRASGDDVEGSDEPPGDPDDPPESLAGLAAVAGEAADRIEAGQGDAENEVFRAWREMTGFLDVPNPRTATPAEFRAAARETGLADVHVDALTDLFRDVRYGGAAATEDREAAAVDALRSIEETYGREGDDGS